MRGDIAVRSADGETILLVEVKARRGRQRDWATQLHRNLKAHGTTGPVRYFLLVTPDEAYLWDEGREADESGFPDATAPTADLLDARLLDTAARDGQALELLVSAWVQSLVAATSSAGLPASARSLLIDSGLFDGLRNGSVLTKAA